MITISYTLNKKCRILQLKADDLTEPNCDKSWASVYPAGELNDIHKSAIIGYEKQIANDLYEFYGAKLTVIITPYIKIESRRGKNTSHYSKIYKTSIEELEEALYAAEKVTIKNELKKAACIDRCHRLNEKMLGIVIESLSLVKIRIDYDIKVYEERIKPNVPVFTDIKLPENFNSGLQKVITNILTLAEQQIKQLNEMESKVDQLFVVEKNSIPKDMHAEWEELKINEMKPAKSAVEVEKMMKRILKFDAAVATKGSIFDILKENVTTETKKLRTQGFRIEKMLRKFIMKVWLKYF